MLGVADDLKPLIWHESKSGICLADLQVMFYDFRLVWPSCCSRDPQYGRSICKVPDVTITILEDEHELR